MIESPEKTLQLADALTARAMFRRAAALFRAVISNQDATDAQRKQAYKSAELLPYKEERHRAAEQARRERREREEMRAAAQRLAAALERAKANPAPRVRFNEGIARGRPRRELTPEQAAAIAAQQQRQADHLAYMAQVAALVKKGYAAADIARQLGRPARTVRYTVQQLKRRSGA